MIIPKIVATKQNFNAFIGWKNESGKELKREELYTLNKIEATLVNKQAKHINITGYIIEPHPQAPHVKRVRFVTSPLLGDIMQIREQPSHEKAMPADYTRKSPWLPLDGNLEGEAIRYTNRQISYIRLCTKDPNHTSQVINKRKGR